MNNMQNKHKVHRKLFKDKEVSSEAAGEKISLSETKKFQQMADFSSKTVNARGENTGKKERCPPRTLYPGKILELQRVLRVFSSKTNRIYPQQTGTIQNAKRNSPAEGNKTRQKK